jgi:hypothetical protein
MLIIFYFFLQDNARMVENLKWLFIAFEGIFGLKVNFVKSELVQLNLSHSKTCHYSQILDYKVGKLLLKYLGVFLTLEKTR